MNDREDPDLLFRKGLQAVQQKNMLSALACFEKAYQAKRSPAVASYYGFCMAVERGKVTEAIDLCRESIAQEPRVPAHYLNLARVYLKAGRKAECLDMLRTGLAAGDDPDIRQLLDEIGLRKPPVFSILPRQHFLNRYVGLILSRLRLR